MGRLVSARAGEEGHEIGAVVTSSQASLAPEELAEVLRGHDAAIDFTVADAVLLHIEACALAGVPLVEGTTGWNAHVGEARAVVERHAGRSSTARTSRSASTSSTASSRARRSCSPPSKGTTPSSKRRTTRASATRLRAQRCVCARSSPNIRGASGAKSPSPRRAPATSPARTASASTRRRTRSRSRTRRARARLRRRRRPRRALDQRAPRRLRVRGDV